MGIITIHGDVLEGRVANIVTRGNNENYLSAFRLDLRERKFNRNSVVVSYPNIPLADIAIGDTVQIHGYETINMDENPTMPLMENGLPKITRPELLVNFTTGHHYHLTNRRKSGDSQ